jgi:hypothetical protein
MPRDVALIELNEVNFDYIRFYCAQGRLPTFDKLIKNHGICETESESKYEELEPWIQWVTAHSGLRLSQHGVFRLGDIHQTDVAQLWEVLEHGGKKVGAISPMNAANRCVAPEFFVPDPWTGGRVNGPRSLTKLYHAISQAVNENATGKLSVRSVIDLFIGLAQYSNLGNYHAYGSFLLGAARGRKWAKALALDRLLADLYAQLCDRYKPDFSSLFLNGAAHIQHHYMFNSSAYTGLIKNPGWYIEASEDPIIEVYELYDQILAEIIRKRPQTRLLIATGLHQNAHLSCEFYWRLRNHAEFLRRCQIEFSDVIPRMSRDFLITFDNPDSALTAQVRLMTVCSMDGTPLFEVDNRGNDLFVTLTWPHDVPKGFVYLCAGQPQFGLRDDVAFVAIKNGHHNSIGYLIDTHKSTSSPTSISLTDIPNIVCEALGLDWLKLRSSFSARGIAVKAGDGSQPMIKLDFAKL